MASNKKGKKYKCPYCDYRNYRSELITHVDDEHEDMIPKDHTPARIVYNSINKKDHGTCMVCRKETKWDEDKQRYNSLCDNPKCKKQYVEIVRSRMVKKYGTYNLLTDPNFQKKMLENRSISGKYKFEDGGSVGYVGSYEKKFLEFMDKFLHIKSYDIISPGPHIPYMYKGKEHVWITDFLYEPYNLVFDIKDGGDNPNTRDMKEYREKQIAKEKAIAEYGDYNYIRLTDNKFEQLISIFMELKEKTDEKPLIRINESFLNEAYIEESVKSTLDANYKPKGKKSLSSFKRVHITESVINKYKKEYPFLKHVRCKDTDYYICDGYIWFDNDELVCMVGSCEYTDDNTKWIVSLEITKNYKGYGLSKQILDYAVKSMKCKYLSVAKSNEIAKKVYDDYGFKVYVESDKMYYMTIDKNVKESSINEETRIDKDKLPKFIYHISAQNHDGETFEPRKYDNDNVKNDMERYVARVCFADSIDGCLYSIFPNGAYDAEFYVHIPGNEVKVYSTTKDDVYDSEITHELWVKEPVQMKCIGKIHVTGVSDTKTKIIDIESDKVPYNKKKYHKCIWKWVSKYSKDSSLYE